MVFCHYIHAMNYEALIAEKDAKIAKLDTKVQELEWRLDQVLRMMYGKKSEAFKPAPYTGPNLFVIWKNHRSSSPHK